LSPSFLHFVLPCASDGPLGENVNELDAYAARQRLAVAAARIAVEHGYDEAEHRLKHAWSPAGPQAGGTTGRPIRCPA